MPYADFDTLEPPSPLKNRWTIVDALGYPVRYWDSYNTNNKFKGDEPLFGEDWFVSFQISSDTIYEPRYIPVPVGLITTARSDTVDTIGDGKSTFFSQSFILEHVLYKGDTTFMPPDLEFRFTPVINYNRVSFEERGLVNIDPTEEDSKGTERTDSFVGIQQLFGDIHLRDVSARYDFDTIRFGIQNFTADFRSFLFNDSALGVRLFGTRANNVFQYNIAYFRRYEKDTNSGLNDVSLGLRKDDVAVFNLFWQDTFVKGYTSEFVLLYNKNEEGEEFYYDDNGFLVRPASIFSERGRDYKVTYLGYNGDGHVGWLNVSASLYGVFGKEDSPTREGKENDVRAYFAAAELSKDFDWARIRVSGLYASADKDPYDDKSEGFDAVLENPLFAGADTSYWIRQALPLIGGGGVAISGRNGVLNSLRSSKEEGQSNFTNPGTALFGIGGDFDILPAFRLSFNVNWIRFVDTTVIETLRQQAEIDPSIGTDVSIAAIWRPFLTQNMIVRFSTAWLIPGDGYKDLYGDDKTPYSVLANLILNY